MKKSVTYLKEKARSRRKLAIRKRIFGTAERPRLVVFRSLTNIYAQIIDDEVGKTLVSMSTLVKEESFNGKTKIDKSFEVGEKLAKRALDKGITQVCFDRAGYKFHGRVKALAEGARKAGLNF
ncbi:MAG: 50S ribosomal protein L18 [Candidatus Cloacimonadales bacterium]|jgi:large subunit ribosomal protein L18|nr:50S ribosomal protein L18 [Candidatus Cloacimonadota bacterium]MDD3501283.1 50S ribosomal protein L18 [Candidatus Cloacimonadota bacterium]MDX9977379.1 50S ribosomal protein L18 [Candidatus Cloacimonadales bacterium]